MALELYAHNKTTYQNLTVLFETEKRVACVQPTGTGKSFIILKLIEDHPDSRFVIASPSTYIFGQIEQYREGSGIEHGNLIYVTYTKLSRMQGDEIAGLPCDYIVLDEFHRCGASEWGKGIDVLLGSHRDVKVLGTSATPIRYLDNCRNMAEEIFGENYAVNMSISEALAQGILPTPVYVASLYSFSAELEKLEARALNSGDEWLKLAVMNKIANAKRMIMEKGYGLDAIFERHMPNGNGKYIVFCSNYEKLREAYEESKSWFKWIDGELHRYIVASWNRDSEREFEAFEKDASKALKLLFCVDMLNEGVHVSGVEGIIMLRVTVSTNVYYQQLGRALSSSDRHVKRPVIFDIVNNYESGQSESLREELFHNPRQHGGYGGESPEFTVHDYVLDIRNILNDISLDLERGWDFNLGVLVRFKKQHSRFPKAVERYEEVKIGNWCSNQRAAYKNGSLPADKIRKLESEGFLWDGNQQIWYDNFQVLKGFIKAEGRFPNSKESHNGFEVGLWCVRMRTLYKAGKLQDVFIKELDRIGMVWDLDEQAWSEKYEALKAFVLEKRRAPYPKEEIGGVKVGAWLIKQRSENRDGTLSEGRQQRMSALGIPVKARSYEEKWTGYYAELRQFIGKKARLPRLSDEFDGINLYDWVVNQKKKFQAGQLPNWKIDLLTDIGIYLVTDNGQGCWAKNLGILRAFVKENGRLPSSKDWHKGYHIGKWLISQRTRRNAGKLAAEKIAKLDNVHNGWRGAKESARQSLQAST
jgi:superfamily II DNA or RNA helicase